jgi:hypothetical protein
MFPFDADCSYCSNLNPNDERKGKFWCEAKKEYVSARGSLCRDKHEVMGRSSTMKKNLRDVSKAHGYYIVTVITKLLELGNDNDYLATFQYVRDVMLPRMPFYDDFVEDYDKFGPLLADEILADENNYEYATKLVRSYLNNFVYLINHNRVDEALDIYISMFEEIKERYGYNELTEVDTKRLTLKVC